MRAARREHLDAARLLLERGADVNARSAKTGADAWGKTALMYAAQAAGLNVLVSGSPHSQQTGYSFTAPVAAIEQTPSAGNSSLSYDTATNT